jgi:hypothetical protein
MTYQELLTEIGQLPLDERLALLEALTHSLRTELRPTPRSGSSVDQVRGLLKPAGPLPTDVELKDDYTRYLIEKYI